MVYPVNQDNLQPQYFPYNRAADLNMNRLNDIHAQILETLFPEERYSNGKSLTAFLVLSGSDSEYTLILSIGPRFAEIGDCYDELSLINPVKCSMHEYPCSDKLYTAIRRKGRTVKGAQNMVAVKVKPIIEGDVYSPDPHDLMTYLVYKTIESGSCGSFELSLLSSSWTVSDASFFQSRVSLIHYNRTIKTCIQVKDRSLTCRAIEDAQNKVQACSARLRELTNSVFSYREGIPPNLVNEIDLFLPVLGGAEAKLQKIKDCGSCDLSIASFQCELAVRIQRPDDIATVKHIVKDRLSRLFHKASIHIQSCSERIKTELLHGMLDYSNGDILKKVSVICGRNLPDHKVDWEAYRQQTLDPISSRCRLGRSGFGLERQIQDQNQLEDEWREYLVTTLRDLSPYHQQARERTGPINLNGIQEEDDSQFLRTYSSLLGGLLMLGPETYQLGDDLLLAERQFTVLEEVSDFQNPQIQSVLLIKRLTASGKVIFNIVRQMSPELEQGQDVERFESDSLQFGKEVHIPIRTPPWYYML